MSLAGEGEAGFAMCRRAVDAAQSSPLWLSNALVNLSLAGVFLGTDEAIEVALDAATRAVPAARRIGSRYYEGGAWGALFGVHRLRVDRRSALGAAAEGMSLMLASGAVEYLTQLLHAVSADLVATDPHVAVMVASAAAGRRGGPARSGTWAEVAAARMRDAVDGRLDPDRFDSAWQQGRNLGLDEVVLLARAAAEDAASY
jgi:hypothetical protein